MTRSAGDARSSRPGSCLTCSSSSQRLSARCRAYRCGYAVCLWVWSRIFQVLRARQPPWSDFPMTRLTASPALSNGMRKVLAVPDQHASSAAQADCDAQSQRVRELVSQAGGSGELQRQLEEQTSLARDLTEVQRCVSRAKHHLPCNAVSALPCSLHECCIMSAEL